MKPAIWASSHRSLLEKGPIFCAFAARGAVADRGPLGLHTEPLRPGELQLDNISSEYVSRVGT